MAGNTIYRGPAERQPRSVTKLVTGALLPGTFVEETATNLVQITTAADKRPLVLVNAEWLGQDLLTAYVSGETGVAFEPEVNQRYNIAMAAATYSLNQPLTIGASGRLAAAATTERVIAYFADTPGAYTAGQLATVVIANITTKV